MCAVARYYDISSKANRGDIFIVHDQKSSYRTPLRHIIQMDATHWWCLRRFPSQCKALWVSRKVSFKCNIIIIIITWAICDVYVAFLSISQSFFIYMYIYIFSSFQSFWMYLIDWDFNLLYFSKEVSSRLHLFDQKYTNCKIVKYH